MHRKFSRVAVALSLVLAASGCGFIDAFIARTSHPQAPVEAVSGIEPSEMNVAVSGDGQFVAFASPSSNLVALDTNNASDVFVRDRKTGTTQRVSVATGGTQATGVSLLPAISDDGRFVAFISTAADLVASDTNGVRDVFVRDRQLLTTTLVSLDSFGTQANQHSYRLAISDDGRYVAFTSAADNLVANDTNGSIDAFVRDRQTNTTSRVSLTVTGQESANATVAGSIAISGDGRYVTFGSTANDLLGPGNDTNGVVDVFVRDRQAGITERVSVDSANAQANNSSSGGAISGDGRYVTFSSVATNLVSDDTNGMQDIFVRDRQTGTTSRVSLTDGELQAHGAERGAHHQRRRSLRRLRLRRDARRRRQQQRAGHLRPRPDGGDDVTGQRRERRRPRRRRAQQPPRDLGRWRRRHLRLRQDEPRR